MMRDVLDSDTTVELCPPHERVRVESLLHEMEAWLEEHQQQASLTVSNDQ